MKTLPLWAWIALLHAPAALAQDTGTPTASTTTTSVAPSCTASQVASLCSYPEPGPEFAVASDSRASCWDYCNAHGPCSFVIFSAGNPNTGTGTCWLYPGETFDASAGSSDCGSPNLYVYSQIECAGSTSTATSSGACAATATPSAVASICGYPTPGDCFDGCTASEGASDCLSQCAEAPSCSYVVFNPHNPSNSPYASGTCWIYSNGTYDAGSATTCSGDPEQFVYDNLCPKPSPSAPSPASFASSSSLSSPSSPSSPSSSLSSPSSSASAATNGSGSAGAATNSTISSENLAPASLQLPSMLVIGVVLLIWQGF